MFPEGSYEFDKMGAAVERAIHFSNGWELRFFTMDVGADQMESASVGLVVIDEPAPSPHTDPTFAPDSTAPHSATT